MKTQKNPLAPKSLVFRIAVFLILINFLLLLYSIQDIPENRDVFYFPLFTDNFFFAQCFSFLIPLIMVAIWAEKQPDREHANQIRDYLLIAVIILVGFFAIVDFLGFSYGSLNHIGTTEFKGDTYHFVDYYVFDDRSKIYLGKCENTKNWCQFHHIYSVYTVYTASTTHHIALNNNGDELSIIVDGDLVYTYDGEQEICINQVPGGSGYCPKP